MNILSGTRKLMLLASFALTLGLLAAPMPSYAGDVAIDNAVRLDPFDPVPQIGFDHGCYDPCGEHHYRRRHRGCDEDCWETYWLNREALRRYERQANMWDELVDIYIDALHLYDHKYLDGRLERDGHFRDVDHHDGDHRDGWRDGDGWHDGDHHDGDHHDGDHHDGDHHDGDHHDGDHHDGDHHDGDHHDGWYDSDGLWHDGY